MRSSALTRLSLSPSRDTGDTLFGFHRFKGK